MVPTPPGLRASPGFVHALAAARRGRPRRASTVCLAAPASHPEPATPDVCTLISWNVASLRTIVKKDGLPLQTLVREEKPAVLCLQETKLQEIHATETFQAFARDTLGFPYVHFNSSRARKGYSGTAVLSMLPFQPPGPVDGVGEPQGDLEGRAITVQLGNRRVALTACYTPNSGAKLARLDYRVDTWEPAMRSHLEAQQGEVLLCGDFNVAPTEVDLWAPDRNETSAGFTSQEREQFQALLRARGGMVDTFRHFHPDRPDAYTYWDYRTRARARNRGWRIDGWLASKPLLPHIRSARILHDVVGSDHCPVALDIGSAAFYHTGNATLK